VKKKTAELEIEWKGGSTLWLPLKEVKEASTTDVAQYAVDNGIDKEPTFD
jgi:hypothetical protein